MMRGLNDGKGPQGLLRGGFGKGNFIIKNEGTPEEKYEMKMGTGDKVGDGKTAILGDGKTASVIKSAVLLWLVSAVLFYGSSICKIFGGLVLGCIETKFFKKCAFDRIFHALQDLHIFAPLQSQFFRKKSV